VKPSGLILLILTVACGPTTPIATIVVEAPSPVVKGDSLGEAIGLETLGAVFTPLLKAGCHIPCEVTETFGTAEDSMTEIAIHLYRGSAQLVTNNHPLGTFAIVGIPRLPRGVAQVRVTVRAANGQILMRARDTSGARIRLESRNR